MTQPIYIHLYQFSYFVGILSEVKNVFLFGCPQV